ncbi:MAG: hypothetical protein AAF745_17510, partial [Planctomycetota bacterium]
REALEQALVSDRLDLALVLTSNLSGGIGLKSKTLHKGNRPNSDLEAHVERALHDDSCVIGISGPRDDAMPSERTFT